MLVKSYDELIMYVAQLSYYNNDLMLFFRGQQMDYQINNETIILPSIYRSQLNKPLQLKRNWEILNNKSSILENALQNRKPKFAGTRLLLRYKEIQWAILQHYQICDTPLLDVSHSLHVACSFALEKKNELGVIQILGLPRLTDNVSYHTYHEIVNIRLLGFCPPQAQRPFFQEGYMLGPFPFYKLNSAKRKTQYDFSRRLIAKFIFPSKNFWGKGFSTIPKDKLYQPDDLFRSFLMTAGLEVKN